MSGDDVVTEATDQPHAAGTRLGPARSKRLLVTLLGDFWVEGQPPIPSATLVRLLEEFGIAPANARAALSRLTQQGLLRRTKQGRRTSYAPTEHALRTLQRGGERIFRRDDGEPWDGTWTLVAFSLTSGDGELRRLLRARLRWLTFAPIFDATWVTPHDRVVQVHEQLDELGITDAIVLRSRDVELLPGGRSRLEQAWRIGELAERYESFLSRYHDLAVRADRDEVDAAEALILRTELVDDWRRLVRDDPDLPAEFLPEGFPRKRARALFLDTYQALSEGARARFDELVSAGP